MEDVFQPLLVILIGGLFAPILTQLIERIYEAVSKKEIDKPHVGDTKTERRKKWLKFFFFAVIIQLALFTGFFFLSKKLYYDRNYFSTNERELIRIGLKKGKDYVIPKMTIRIFSESPRSVGLSSDSCDNSLINYCMLVSISYEIVALRDYTSEKLFTEGYYALYAEKVIKEPGSEVESSDFNPKMTHLVYGLTTTMAKFERKTVTTRADYLYDNLPRSREFFGKDISGRNFDMFYYPNNEDDVIGEVEFQVISRTLKFDTPGQGDAIYEHTNMAQEEFRPVLTVSNDEIGCLHFNILTARIPRLNNNEKFGIKWTWRIKD